MKVESFLEKMTTYAHFTRLIILIVLINASSCAFRRVSRDKNITYWNGDSSRSIPPQELNIFSPKRPKENKDVFIFIHGGSWKIGKKNHYNFLGNRMARKGIVAVVIEYPLSSTASYNEMAIASATAVSWVHSNIKAYGGNPEKIFVSGHSAGGHLAALISVTQEYFDSLNIDSPIKGAILIDAAGLDMHGYLEEEKLSEGHSYLKTFTSNPRIWKEASPINHLHKNMPPFLIYRGEDTYPSIEKSNEKFIKSLKRFVPSPNYKVQKGKKHIPMILQFFWTWNPIYDEIVNFMKHPE